MSTSDDPFATRTRLVVVAPDDGYRFLATQIVSPPPIVAWSNMHTRGVNEAGFAYTWSYVTPAAGPTDATAIGIPYFQWGQLFLSRAARIDDALSLLDRYPRAIHGNYLFADATGEICLVEVCPESLHVAERTGSGMIGRTNHWLSGVKTSVEDASLACSSRHRLDRVTQLLEKHEGDLDLTSQTEICRDHVGSDQPGNGYSICAHGHVDDGALAFGTVSSEVIEPNTRTLWYCYGWPCGGAASDRERQPYQELSWGTYLPFRLDELNPGELVTIDGRLTPPAWRSLARYWATPSPNAASG